MKRAILVLMGFIILGGLIMYSLLYEPSRDFEEEKKFVYVVNSGQNYWADVQTGAETAGQDLGVYVKICNFQRFDLEEQLQLLNSVLYMDVDGVITVGEPYSMELNEKIREIVNAGIPVVLIDTDSEASERTCYVGSNNYLAGQMAAEIILDNIDEGAQIYVIVSALEYANQQERVDGFCDTIKASSKGEVIEVFEGNADKVMIQEYLDDLITREVQVDAIFCTETAGTVQTGLYFQNMDEISCILVGFDNGDSVYEFIREGIYKATIVQANYDIGYQAVQFLYDYPEMIEVQDNQYTEIVCVTAENLEEYIASQRAE